MTTDILRNFGLSISITVIAGCAIPQQSTNLNNPQLDQVNKNISQLEKSLSSQIIENCKRDNKQLVSQLAAVISTNTAMQTEKKPVEVEYVEGCLAGDENPETSNKLLMGEVENVYLVKEKVGIEARIDTGAETSSLGVYNLARFERDGEKWVRFTLSEQEDAPVHRYVVFDSVRIKQESDEKAERRREIQLDIMIGKKKYRKQVFNLADRSHLAYQILIGRNFLRDIAIVDVSASHLQDGD